jgi:hypothetical protein
MSNLYRGHAIDASYQVSVHKIAHLVPIRLQTRLPEAILVSDWPILFNLLL